jgi:hypothetical protein
MEHEACMVHDGDDDANDLVALSVFGGNARALLEWCMCGVLATRTRAMSTTALSTLHYPPYTIHTAPYRTMRTGGTDPYHGPIVLTNNNYVR